MARNVEWKARLRDPDRALAAALAAGAADRGVLRQRDTYFAVAHGRLKLREQEPGGAELVQYRRADRAEARVSDYRVVPAPDPVGLRAALSEALGVRVVVDKERHLLLHGRTRVHLDAVEGLGSFAEVEVVLAEGDDVAAAREEAERWRDRLGVAASDVEPRSYADLLLAASR
ncbi:MAG TPA: class IV adenylate cyclase [Capillimicrobium sp.]|nr:class IV adenylate cyclase [Capillimicrobium sp.]